MFNRIIILKSNISPLSLTLMLLMVLFTQGFLAFLTHLYAAAIGVMFGFFLMRRLR